MKEHLIFIDGLYIEIMQVSASLRNNFKDLKTGNPQNMIVKLNLTIALMHSLAWILALKAARGGEQIHMSDYIALPDIDFAITGTENKSLTAAVMTVENLYQRVLRLNSDLISRA